MRVVILGTGPSLTRFAGGGEVVIGINRAALLQQCDLWACLDWIGSDRQHGLIGWIHGAIGSPILLTTADAVESLRRHGYVWRGRVERIDDVASAYRSPVLMYSLTAAMAYAVNALGATELEMWGVDFAGFADWDGGNRKSHCGNWGLALHRFNELRAELETNGVRVKRNT
jgi:hypothetical protein